jgi:hypothetical protein
MYACDAGYYDMLDVYFRGATAPTAFAMRLVHDTVLGTDNWADILANEIPSANGYTTGGATINRDATANGWPTLALDSADEQIIGKKCSWTASGDWATSITAVTIVADKAVDQLVMYSNITALTPLTGDTVAWTPKFKLKKVCA